MRRVARRQQLYRATRRRRSSACVLIIWTILPIYNIVMVSLEGHSDVFSGAIWPAEPSLEGYWVVFTQGYWYLENFWHQFGNSVYVGAATTFLMLSIASVASFSISRMRVRHGWLVSNAALLTYVIPASFLAIPFYRIMQNYGLTQQSVVGHRRDGDLRDPLCDVHLPAIRPQHSDGARQVGADRRRLAGADLSSRSICR